MLVVCLEVSQVKNDSNLYKRQNRTPSFWNQPPKAHQHPPPHLHPSPKAMSFFRKQFFENLMDFWQILGKFWEIQEKNWHFFEEITKIFANGQGKNEHFSKNVNFLKEFFANISRTVRARAKILVEINPLGHIHTPPHLFKLILYSKYNWSRVKRICIFL